jgi:hypothetical protein
MAALAFVQKVKSREIAIILLAETWLSIYTQSKEF